MANVNLPRAVVGLGAVICVAGGYLVGVAVTSGEASLASAEVASFDADTSELCLRGGAVADEAGDELSDDVDGEGDDASLCGYWMQPQDARVPASGDEFQFSLHATDTPPEGERTMSNVLIYGAVVD